MPGPVLGTEDTDKGLSQQTKHKAVLPSRGSQSSWRNRQVNKQLYLGGKGLEGVEVQRLPAHRDETQPSTGGVPGQVTSKLEGN